jgi:hypothetical protein
MNAVSKRRKEEFACDAPVSRAVNRELLICALNHYAVTDDCMCMFCSEWKQRISETQRTAKLTAGHSFDCMCLYCRVSRKIRIGFLAAQNRRDFLSEMSFHAFFRSNRPDLVMRWALIKLDDPRMTSNWCAIELPRLPMQYWLSRCERSLAPQVYGGVFRQEDWLRGRTLPI